LLFLHEPDLATAQCPGFSIEILERVSILCVRTHHSAASNNVRLQWIQGENRMTKSFRLALTLAALIGMAPVLSACHTTAGVGEDISQGGHALTNSATANAPTKPSP
jgi:predicted small secreted protein